MFECGTAAEQKAKIFIFNHVDEKALHKSGEQ